MISCAVHRASAKRLPAALRKPCAVQPESPAARQRLPNQLERPAGVNGEPRSLTRKVKLLRGTDAKIRTRSGGILIINGVAVFSCRTAIHFAFTCCQPLRTTSPTPLPGYDPRAKAKRSPV